MNMDNHINQMQERVKIDVNNTSNLLKRVRALQENNTFWAHECEKLHTLGWYKFGFFVSCVLNVMLIISIIMFGWWLWVEL